jgi:hypothetical protein
VIDKFRGEQKSDGIPEVECCIGSGYALLPNGLARVCSKADIKHSMNLIVKARRLRYLWSRE